MNELNNKTALKTNVNNNYTRLKTSGNSSDLDEFNKRWKSNFNK